VSKHKFKAILTGLLLLLLAACQSIPKKAKDFAPVPPIKKVAPIKVTGSIYNASTAVLLFEDRKAKRIGDILTIVLNESTNATKKASTSTKKDNSVETGFSALFGLSSLNTGRRSLNNSLNSSKEFSGSGDSSQSNKLSGTIAVTVISVLSNGNLKIRGQKRLLLNRGEERIQISGIVRPSDITGNNTVSSTQVANARIVYSGKGVISDSNSMGWLSRFFNSKIWPF